MEFKFVGVLVRFLVALLLVFISFNPSGYSYFHWAFNQVLPLPVIALIGVLVCIGWVIFLRATLRSLGPVGISLSVALFACLIWVAIYYDVVNVASQGFVYILLVLVAAVLAVGMSWSHVRRKISGQTDINDDDQ